MGKNELSAREAWQPYGGEKASKAERNFLEVFTEHFQGTDFIVKHHPNEFKNIYSSIQLPPDVRERIYNPDETWNHGISPDFSIHNKKTNKTIYVEVKRQDGWVEGKERKAGRGNAHERSCKFFTPGLLKIMREKGKIEEPALPFWVVFQGDIARDPKRVREIHCWYTGIENHFFLWSDSSDTEHLINHFETRIKHLLI
jgi:hypothetical protein